MKAFGDGILAKPIHPKKELPSGIIIPDTVNEHSHQAIVESVGKKVREVQPGDVIYFLPNGWVPVEEESPGKPSIIFIREEKVLCIYREPKNDT